MGDSLNQGTFLGGPHNKDCSIFGSILGSLYFGKLPYREYAYQDLPCTLNWGYMVPNSGYL